MRRNIPSSPSRWLQSLLFLCFAGGCLELLALYGPRMVQAADNASVAIDAIDEEWRLPLKKFATFIATLSAGQSEEAWQQWRVMLPNPPLSPRGPFEPDPYEHFIKGLGRFPKELESLSIIGERRFTANSRKFTLIGDTLAGPVVVEVLIFRSRGDWYFGTLGYQVVNGADTAWLRQYDDLLPATRYPVSVELELPVIAVTPAAASIPTKETK